MRLVEQCGTNDGVKRTVYIGSWFCSVKTWAQLASKYSYHVIGAVKTAYTRFPAEMIRWALKDMTRGKHVVFKCEGEDLWAIGWSDAHFKLYSYHVARRSRVMQPPKNGNVLTAVISGSTWTDRKQWRYMRNLWGLWTNITGLGRGC